MEDIITLLKSCLRIPNQHLTTATLSALPSFVGVLFPSNQPIHQSESLLLRQLLSAFLPSGGVIDRLGDSRERAREKARESLVVLGGLAHQHTASLSLSVRAKEGGKASESTLSIFEGYIRENAFQSKNWRVREQVRCLFANAGITWLKRRLGNSHSG